MNHAEPAKVPAPIAVPPGVVQPGLTLDGTQLLPRGHYCAYQGRAFHCYQDGQQVRLSVDPGESIPDGFEPKDDRNAGPPAIAYKTVPATDITSFYEVITSCWYKGAPFSVRAITGAQFQLSIGGGRRHKLVRPEPPSPTMNEWGDFPNAEVLGMGEIWAEIDIIEAARLTMAVVPYHLSGEHLVPVNDPTGYHYPVPKADEIFYFPSPLDSPFLPGNDAVTTITAHLAVHDPGYPTTGLTPERLRDGWRLNPTTETPTIYYITDDSHIITAPATAPTAHIASQMSAEFRNRHPIENPPPAHDTGTDIFD